MEKVADYRNAAVCAAEITDAKKAENLILYDMRKLTSFTDYMIIATVNSSSQKEAVIKELKEKLSIRPLHVEGASKGGWSLIDYGGLVINLFYPEERAFYSLERIWGDAEKVSV